MKILLISLAIITCLYTPIHAEEDEKETKYQVIIEVTYNAVTIKEANRITADAIERHQEACKVRVESTKDTGEAFGSNLFFRGSQGSSITIPDIYP